MTAVAVVGTGFIGPVHVEALHRLGITVKGILGSTVEKSRQATQQLGLSTVYPDFQSILADEDVTAVHITTPNNTHYEMSLLALRAGKHVICEKPLAMNTGETLELVEMARSRPNLVAAVNTTSAYRWSSGAGRRAARSARCTRCAAYLQDWLLYDPTGTGGSCPKKVARRGRLATSARTDGRALFCHRPAREPLLADLRTLSDPQQIRLPLRHSKVRSRAPRRSTIRYPSRPRIGALCCSITHAARAAR
jgi:hypothetical protein